MGILSNLTGSGSGGSATHGGHSISSSSLLQQTHGSAITPTNPGNLTNVRTHQIVDRPRVFTQGEADRICINEAMASHVIQHTRRAFRALGKQEGHDASLQEVYRDYQGKVATNELRKVRSNAKLGKVLHGMRAAYAQLGFGTQQAEMGANQRVSEIKARLMGIR